MKEAKKRVPGHDWEEVQAIWDNVVNDRHLEQRPVPNRGLFLGENDNPIDQERALARARAEAPEVNRLCLRPSSRVFNNTNLQAIDRENRKRRGRADSELIINNLVALRGHYLPEVDEDERHDFWVGRIIGLDYDERQLQISYYNTGTKRCLAARTAKYRAWTGTNKTEWVDIRRVLHTFESFTDKMAIKAEERRRIGNALALPESDAEDSE